MEFFSSYTGGDFLAFYAVMLVTCIFAGIWIPANLRAEGRRGEVTEPEEMAVLAGGRNRHAQAVTTDLIARGGIAPASKGKLRAVQTDLEAGATGRSLLCKIGEFDMREIGVSTAANAAAIHDDLIGKGLLMDSSERMKLRWLSILPYAALLMLGLYRQQAGDAAGEPTGLLIMMLILTAGLAIARFFKINPRTIGGNETLRSAEVNAARMRSAPTAPEAGYAVALFGTAVLIGTPWEPVHAMRQAGGGGEGGYSGDGGDGGSDGGAGCGGGCGGCGG